MLPHFVSLTFIFVLALTGSNRAISVESQPLSTNVNPLPKYNVTLWFLREPEDVVTTGGQNVTLRCAAESSTGNFSNIKTIEVYIYYIQEISQFRGCTKTIFYLTVMTDGKSTNPSCGYSTWGTNKPLLITKRTLATMHVWPATILERYCRGLSKSKLPVCFFTSYSFSQFTVILNFQPLTAR